MKKLIFLLLFLIILSGCTYINFDKRTFNSFPNRDINKQEVENFIPINYKAVNKNDWSDGVYIEKLVINGEYFYFFPLLPESSPLESADTIKILLLKYNREKDYYYKVDEYLGEGNMNLKIMEVNDIDNDDVSELFVSFDENWGGSGTAHYIKVFKIDQDKIREIFSINDTISQLYLYDTPKRIMGASFIWAEGETHFGCHYWDINEYHYDNEDGFYLYNTSRTKVKYDMGDEYQIDYKNCFPFPTDLYNFFENERMIR